jgi:hypothetical protein
MYNAIIGEQVRPRFRTQLPRLYELVDLIADPTDSNAYFARFEDELRDPDCLKTYRRWEREVDLLDRDSWEALKCKAAPYLRSKDSKGRGWTQLFDHIGEARAYNYLIASEGCSAVRFIPESSSTTPDLEGTLVSGRFLCEVKTLNISDVEVRARRNQGKVRSPAVSLNEGFFGKLDGTIADAKGQLQSYDSSAQHLIYINLCFDDSAGTYKTDYRREITQHLVANPVGVKVIVNDKC